MMIRQQSMLLSCCAVERTSTTHLLSRRKAEVFQNLVNKLRFNLRSAHLAHEFRCCIVSGVLRCTRGPWFEPVDTKGVWWQGEIDTIVTGERHTQNNFSASLRHDHKRLYVSPTGTKFPHYRPFKTLNQEANPRNFGSHHASSHPWAALSRPRVARECNTCLRTFRSFHQVWSLVQRLIRQSLNVMNFLAGSSLRKNPGTGDRASRLLINSWRYHALFTVSPA